MSIPKVLIRGILILSYAVSSSLYADSSKIFTFSFPPPGYAEVCETYRNLARAGKTVKAERLAKSYQKEHFDPVFKLREGESRIVKILQPRYFYPEHYSDDRDFVTFAQRSPGEIRSDRDGLLEMSLNSIKIPKKNLEKWQDIMHDKFSREPSQGKYLITDITLRVRYDTSGKFFVKNLVQDCFWENNFGFAIDGSDIEISLISYKLVEVNEKVQEGSVGDQSYFHEKKPRAIAGKKAIEAFIFEGDKSGRLKAIRENRDILDFRQWPGDSGIPPALHTFLQSSRYPGFGFQDGVMLGKTLGDNARCVNSYG